MQTLKDFWQNVEDATNFLGHNDSLMTKMLEGCLNEMASRREFAKDSDYHHLRGYIYYSMRPQKLLEARIEFEKSLEQDPTNSHSKLYLGHTYYDLGDYLNAQKEFSSIKKNSLPAWLMMKVDEMIVCCQMNQSSILNETEIQTFVEKYAPIDYFDDYPFELSKLLKQRGRSLENEEMNSQKSF